MRKGIVIHIDPLLGRGYIQDENDQDIFFILSDLTRDLQVGSTVKFEIKLDEEGLVAYNVLPMRFTCEVFAIAEKFYHPSYYQ